MKEIRIFCQGLKPRFSVFLYAAYSLSLPPPPKGEGLGPLFHLSTLSLKIAHC